MRDFAVRLRGSAHARSCGSSLLADCGASKGAVADGLEVYIAEGTYFTLVSLGVASFVAAARWKQLGHFLFGVGMSPGIGCVAEADLTGGLWDLGSLVVVGMRLGRGSVMARRAPPPRG